MFRLLLLHSGIAILALIAISLPQLADPLIRFDDYPAYFGDEEAFYSKTLGEGRWINYWWIARPFLWSPTANFIAYQLACAIFSAGAALNALGPDARPLRVAALALLIALGPQFFLISGWFNTLVLGAWIVALYAVISVLVSARTGLILFAIFAPISMMAYSTYPFLMFAMCLTRYDAPRSFRRLVGLMILFAVSIGLGMALMFTLNYFEHGVFGIEISEWRSITPKATDLSSYVANARELVPRFAGHFFLSVAYGVPALGIVNIGFLVLALVVLLARRPIEAVYIASGIGAFIFLVLFQSVKEGTSLPERTLIAVWVLFSISLLRVATYFEERRQLVDAGLVVLVALYGGQLAKNTRMFMPWQTETREIAALVPASAERVFVYGDAAVVRGHAEAHIHHQLGLTERLRILKGVTVYPCHFVDFIICEADPPFDPETPTDEMLIQMVGNDAFIRLPASPDRSVASAR